MVTRREKKKKKGNEAALILKNRALIKDHDKIQTQDPLLYLHFFYYYSIRYIFLFYNKSCIFFLVILKRNLYVISLFMKIESSMLFCIIHDLIK